MIREWPMAFHSDTASLQGSLAAIDMHTAQHIVRSCFTGSLAENRTIILVTHHITLCLDIASYVVELDAGRVLYHGAKSELIREGILDEVIESEDQPGAEAEDSPTIREPELSTDFNDSETATRTYSPGPDSDLADGKLIEAEARAEGRVSVRTYLTYIYAAGVWCWISTFIIMLLIRLIGIGNQVSVKPQQIPAFANKCP